MLADYREALGRARSTLATIQGGGLGVSQSHPSAETGPNSPSSPEGGPREPTPRVILQNASTARVTVTPQVAGTAHVILAVEDDGSPTLTAYRRVILRIAPKK